MSEAQTTSSYAEIEARLERALAALGRPHAAFATDGDGTLWEGDIGEAFFAMALARGCVGVGARDALAREASEHGVEVDPSSTADAFARALFAAYSRGEYAEDRICAVIAWCVAGEREASIATLAAELLATEVRLADRIQPEAIAILRWATAQGLPTYLVSASPRIIVAAAARVVEAVAGVPPMTVLAMSPRLENGVICPEIEGTWTYGPGKAEAVARALASERRQLVGAMGDSAFDADMLRAAAVPIGIRPKPSLIAVASSIGGFRIAAR